MKERPMLVTFISDLNFLNVFLLIISFFPEFTKRFGLIMLTPTFFGNSIKVLVIFILLIISYGLLKLKNWGYWLMIAYNMFFLLTSILAALKVTGQSFYNLGYIPSILGLILTFPAKRYFIKET